MNIKEISIVLSGQWNTSLFTPNWVFKNVFHMKEGEEAEVGIDNNNFKLVYKVNGISFIPNESLLEIKITDGFTDDKLRYASKTALEIIQLLPHTPNLAVGINFKFEQSARLGVFSNLGIIDSFKLNQLVYKKEIENGELNMIIDKNYTLFNFHHPDVNLYKYECISSYFKESEELWNTI
jgi:hypothetical protein